MSVSLSPAQTLGFHRPLTTLSKQSLTLSNPNSTTIIFKVKTTAPKAYCVRPNSGKILPGESVTVLVLLQPMKVDPIEGTKCRDKFLVQSAKIVAGEGGMGEMSLAEAWATIEATDKQSITVKEIHEQKIRCSYLPAIDSLHSSNGVIEEEDNAAADLSLAGSAMVGGVSLGGDSKFIEVEEMREAEEGERVVTPVEEISEIKAAVVSPVARAIDVPSRVIEPKVEAVTPIPTIAPVPAAPISTESKAVLELTELVSKLRLENAQLKSELSNASELRSRNVVKNESKTVVMEHPIGSEDGISLKVLAIAIGTTFVFTWLFF